MDPESDTGACARDATRDTGAARTPTAGMPRDMENAAIVLCFTLVAKATARRKVMNDCAGEGGVDALFFCVSPPFSLEAEEKTTDEKPKKKGTKYPYPYPYSVVVTSPIRFSFFFCDD